MSDYVVHLIPTRPDFVPANTDTVTAALLDAVRMLQLGEEDVGVVVGKTTVFVDAGENWGKILCPSCGRELPNAWWSQAMQAAFLTEFANLTATTPCCDSLVSLNDLVYEWPVGFAKVVITVRNPDRRPEAAEVEMLERVVGCRLRLVEAHV